MTDEERKKAWEEMIPGLKEKREQEVSDFLKGLQGQIDKQRTAEMNVADIITDLVLDKPTDAQNDDALRELARDMHRKYGKEKKPVRVY